MLNDDTVRPARGASNPASAHQREPRSTGDLLAKSLALALVEKMRPREWSKLDYLIGVHEIVEHLLAQLVHEIEREQDAILRREGGRP